MIGVPGREVGRDGQGARGAARRAPRRPRPSSSRTAARGSPHYKCPTSVEFRDELARTATGKLQKFKLRAALLGRPRPPGQLTPVADRHFQSNRE